jgi:hypothetical protein
MDDRIGIHFFANHRFWWKLSPYNFEETGWCGENHSCSA